MLQFKNKMALIGLVVSSLMFGACLVEEEKTELSSEQKARQELQAVQLDSSQVNAYTEAVLSSKDAQMTMKEMGYSDAQNAQSTENLILALEQILGAECTKALFAVQAGQFPLEKAQLLCQDAWQKLQIETQVNPDGTVTWSDGDSGYVIVQPDGWVNPGDGEMCPEIWAPVCGYVDYSQQGPDGVTTAIGLTGPQTFGNTCELKRAKGTFLYQGECRDNGVDPTEPDSVLVDPRDGMCPMIWAPVCGVDAKCAELQASGAKIACPEQTYSNDCVLEKTGGKFLRKGECQPAVDLPLDPSDGSSTGVTKGAP
jgi:hypothetical protein